MGRISILVLGAALVIAALGAQQNGASPNTKKQNSGKTKAEKKPADSSLTGCMDEQDGKYVLLEEKTVRKLADLKAEGFSQEDFAKYVGQKVTVRGQSASDEGRSVFNVRGVDLVSAQCSPAGQ